MVIAICPCRVSDDEQISYTQCCQPLHQKLANAKTAEQLMRSRYAAFVLTLSDYIIETTLPAQQPLLDKQAIAEWAEQTDWAGLQIIQHRPKLGKHHAQVEFNAYCHVLNTGSYDKAWHHELSTFVFAKDQPNAERKKWYFLDPTLDMSRLNLTQKQPCFCGSGEKFKRCCGQYL